MATKHITDYGVWKIAPEFTWDNSDARSTDRSPHGKLLWTDPVKGSCDCAINVQSTGGGSSLLVYWEYSNFNKTHLVIKGLEKLAGPAFYEVKAGGERADLRLDLFRGNILTIGDGKMWPRATPQQGDDLVDHLDRVINDAIARGATLYLFGERYDHSGRGIHQTHQNQGNFYIANEGPRIMKMTRDFFFENGVGQDGGLFFHFPDDDTWTAVFLAFATQAVGTDDIEGIPLDGAKNYLDTLTGSETTPPEVAIPPGWTRGGLPTPPVGGGGGGEIVDPDWPSEPGPESGAVLLTAVLVNPAGASDDDEQIRIVNKSSKPVNLQD
jgi:uncharacterized protein YukJ